MNETSLLRVAVYIRVSSDEQAKFGDSMRDQKERGIEYIDKHENMVLQDVYVDDGISGQKLNRDEFTRLIEAVKNDQVNLIIFTKLDRWFRSLRHYLNTQAVLEEHGTAWIAIDQPYFDTSTPHGRAFVAQSMMWAELEAQNDGLRIRDVFTNKVKYGEAITGKVPRGYQIENKHLVLGPEAPKIHDTFLYFLKTQSLHSTVKYLREEHGIVMTLQNLKTSILHNEKYTGRYRGNENYCPRLVTDETFQAIQRVLDSNINIKSSQRYPYIFSGLLVCHECGYKFNGCQINVVSKRKSGKEYRYRYPAYECKQNRAYAKCINGGEIREVRIEEYLLEHVRDELSNYITAYETGAEKVIDNRARKNAIRKKLDLLKELYLNEGITLDEYKSDRIRYLDQLESLPDTVESRQDLTKLKSFLAYDFEALYCTFDNQEKRAFWRSIIKEIRVHKSVNRSREYDIVFL